jgi:hypothetical protein
MQIDPQVNPLIVVPILIALVLALCLLWLGGADGRLRLAVFFAIGFVIIIFFLSRTALF